MSRVGAVVIGRNEAPRLRRCLESVIGRAAPVVFVDSGSTDGSADLARSMGVDVVELDRARPFTIARARNEGTARLQTLAPSLEFVQFVDGDTEMLPEWFAPALQTLAAHADLAVVFGRHRERDPRRSIYTRLYAIDADPRMGDPRVCGGMAMMRLGAFRQAGGFVVPLLGNEDGELCFRLRQAGWRIQRLDVEMAVHEASMGSFGGWWRRRIRVGHSEAQLLALHRGSPEHPGQRQTRSTLFWGIALPALAVAGAWPSGGASLLLLGGHAALWLRIYRRMRRLEFAPDDAALYAGSCIAAKFPQVIGQARFRLERAAGWPPLALP